MTNSDRYTACYLTLDIVDRFWMKYISLGIVSIDPNSRRKHESMAPHNLFSLLVERLMLNSDQLTMATYNVLFEVGELR